MRRLPILVSALAATTLVAVGCGGGNRSASSSGPVHYVNDGTFTMAYPADIGSFDPYQGRATIGVATLAYDSLVNVASDGRFVSGLAKSWSADANSATFTLRRDVTCSDGTPLTAGQVAADLTFVSDPNNAPTQYGVNVPTVPYTATGDDATGTVRVTMASPYGFLLNTLGRVPIVCAAGMRDRTKLASGSVGTGPFVLTNVVAGQSYTFSARKGYAWGPGGASTSAAGTPATVVLRIITSETTAANLLLTGQLNFAKILGNDRDRLAARGLTKQDWPIAGAWLSFNENGGRTTADVRVRQALAGALELDQLVKVSTGGSGTAATSLISMLPKPCTADTVTGQLPRHDLAAAGSLLEGAGWTKGAGGTRARDGKPLMIDLHYYAAGSPFEEPTAELLAQQWKALGVKVTLSSDSAAGFVKNLYQDGNWDVYIGGYNFGLPSQMVPYLSGATPPTGNNTGYVHNARYDALAAKAVTLTPPSACTYWDQAERAIVRDVDIAPISNRAEHWFLRGAQAQITRYETPVPTSIRVLG